ncbi:MAG: helix-turn-helix domain-containing protein [Nocardiopsaceae bacterium]|nr:helix-turn-helix domain-containing protein [Nocardiopsaceae bacterium]
MSIGETLADARRQSGLTIAQVSQRTRIRESIIRAIEQNDFTSCGGDFYARGHIRSIAGAVNCDPAPLVREYDNEHPSSEISAAEVFEPTAPIKIREPRRRRPLGILAVVVLLAVIGYFSYRLAGGSDDSHSTATPAATVTPAATPTSSPTAAPSPTASPTARKPEAVIVLTADQRCWVNLTAPGGHQIYQGVVAAGKTLTWKEKHKVSLVLGNPPGVALRVNGKRIKPDTAGVVTLSIDPSARNPVAVAAPAGTKLAASR